MLFKSICVVLVLFSLGACYHRVTSDWDKYPGCTHVSSKTDQESCKKMSRFYEERLSKVYRGNSK